MELALICAQQVIVLFLLIGVGTLAVKTGVLKLEHKRQIQRGKAPEKLPYCTVRCRVFLFRSLSAEHKPHKYHGF